MTDSRCGMSRAQGRLLLIGEVHRCAEEGATHPEEATDLRAEAMALEEECVGLRRQDGMVMEEACGLCQDRGLCRDLVP